jgi:hypothetical protein
MSSIWSAWEWILRYVRYILPLLCVNLPLTEIQVKKGQAVTAVWVEADAFDEIGRNIPQAVSTFIAQLNQTASVADTDYDTYSVTITDQVVLGASSMNVAATIGGNTVRDWTIFRLGQTGFGNC